jgi:HAMP domain-containing protein
MASNLTGQVRNIAEVTTAVAKGDLSKKITVDVKGEVLELKNTINTMVDQLRRSPRRSRAWRPEVGTEASSAARRWWKGFRGTWKDLTDSVNSMAGNLTAQVRNIADVTTAVARGRPVAQDHGGREGRDPRSSRTPSTRWWTSSRRSHRR